MSNSVLVSIIIPCRNEGSFIAKCLDSIIAQDYPKEKLEVLVVDGMSEDETREIIKRYHKQYPFIRLLDNPRKITPCALNIGINQSNGKVIIRMDAHSEYFSDYIKETLACLERTNAENVGGIRIIKPGADTLTATAIALVTSCLFGVGMSKYRFSGKSSYVDTVPNGAFKKELFDRIGYFNEKLIRNQDNEFNERIIKNGGRVFLSPTIKSYYYNQATLPGLLHQALRTGMWNVITLKINPSAFRWRHFIPFIFVMSFLLTAFFAFFESYAEMAFLSLIGLYGSAAIISSLQIGFKERTKYFWILPLMFFIYHFCYGLGTLFGIAKIVLIGRSNVPNTTEVKT